MEYYSTLKKNEILPFATRVNLEGIMLREKSQIEKNRYCMVPLICRTKNKNVRLEWCLPGVGVWGK